MSPSSGQPSSKGGPNNRDMFVSFMRIGTFTLGGGLAMLPLIEREFVEKRGWMDHGQMAEILAVSQSLPGVIAINSALIVGYRTKGLTGALWAAAGMILPSFLIILIIAQFLTQVREVELVSRAFSGVRACMTALMLVTAVKLGRRTIKNVSSLVVFVLAFIALGMFDVNFALVLSASAILGIAAWGFKKLRDPGKGGPGGTE